MCRSLTLVVIEHVIDFLWNDPPSLLSCALTCHALAYRSRILLHRKTILTIRSAEEMQLYAGILAYRRSRGLLAKLRTLHIIDSTIKPFVHTLPLFFPLQHLPEVAMVALEGINWSILEPHTAFFRKLAELPTAESICLHRCILRPAAHAVRLVRSLSRLQDAAERQCSAACLPRGPVLFDCVLIGKESDRDRHKCLHPNKNHKTMEEGEIPRRRVTQVLMII